LWCCTKRIVDINQPYYSEELLGLIPGELLDKALADDNLQGTSIEIDQLRFQKQNELLNLRGIATSPNSEIPESVWQELRDIINNKERFDELSPEQQRKVKEIKFLSNVALTVLHQ
jgi:hypothetical protein